MDQMRAQHFAVWTALDEIAVVREISTSALAKLAGMDGTAFNPSKRTNPDGSLRWPSTSTIVAVLAATGTSWSSFAAYVEALSNDTLPPPPPVRNKPLIAFAGK